MYTVLWYNAPVTKHTLYIHTSIDNGDTVDDIDISQVHLPPGCFSRGFSQWMCTVIVIGCTISIHSFAGPHMNTTGHVHAKLASILFKGQVP